MADGLVVKVGPQMRAEQQIYEEAAAWVEQLAELSPEQQQQLELWLAQSEQHQHCYQRCLKLWQSQQLESALRTSAPVPRAEKSRFWQLAWLPAAAALVMVAVLQWPVQPELTPLLLSTTAGAAQQKLLPDGSTVQMAGESQLSFSQTAQQRQVQLKKGEALFHVTHLQDEQPFIVDTGAVQVRVTGTRFSVNKLSSHTLVTVVEGSVRVSASGQTYQLIANQQLKLIPGVKAAVVQLAAGYQHPMQQRWLQVQDMPLGELLEQLDRYLPEQILLPDVKAAQLPVSGRFDLEQPLDAVHLAAAAAQLKVSPYAGQLVLRSY